MEETTAVQNIFSFNEKRVAVFKIYPDEAYNSKLRDWIEMAGGVVLDPGENDPYAIPVVDTHWYVEEKGILPPKKLPADHFASSFIYKSLMRGKCVDLNNHRISKSMYEDFDANLILRREIQWNQLKKIAPGKKPRLQKDSFRSSDSNYDRANQGRAKKRRVEVVNGEATRARSMSVSSSVSNELSIFITKSLSTPVKSPLRKGWSSRKKVEETNETENRVAPNASPTRNVRRKVLAEVGQPQDPDDEAPETSNQLPRGENDDGKGQEDVNNSRASSRKEKSPEDSQSKYFKVSSKRRNDHRAGHQRPRSVSRSSSSSAGSIHESVAQRANAPTIRPKARSYTLDEDQVILDYICKHNLHSEWKGIKMWDIMEEEKVLRGRTAQSMKERFRKQIFKNLQRYACSSGDIRKIKEGQYASNRGKHKTGRTALQRMFKARRE